MHSRALLGRSRSIEVTTMEGGGETSTGTSRRQKVRSVFRPSVNALLVIYMAFSRNLPLLPSASAKSSTLTTVPRFPYTPLHQIERALLTTAEDDFEGQQESYATAADWHSSRLRSQSSSMSNAQGVGPSWFGTDAGVGLRAPYLACAPYGSGKNVLRLIRAYLRNDAVRVVSHTEEVGVCIMVTATPPQADYIVEDLSIFGLTSFGIFPSALKLSPGLLDHGEDPISSSDRTIHLENEQLRTTHGQAVLIPNADGLVVELSPGVLPSGSAAARAVTDEILGGLRSRTLDLQSLNFWSDISTAGVERARTSHPNGLVRTREWTRAANLIHFQARKRRNVAPAQVCKWNDVSIHHSDQDMLIVTGIGHLLPYGDVNVFMSSAAPDSYDPEDANSSSELQMACFMAFLSYLAGRAEVLRVSPKRRPTMLNAVGRAIVQSGNIYDSPLSAAGLDGTGEVVQVIDSGVDETSCFFIDDSGQEIVHGNYFEELAFLTYPQSYDAVLVVFTGGDYPVDMTRRKIVQYIETVKADDVTEPYGSGVTTTSGESISWSSADGFGEDLYDGHGTHTAGSVAGATLTSPAELDTCATNQERGCDGSCLNQSTIDIIEESGLFFIESYCPRYNCSGEGADSEDCLGNDVSNTLAEHGGIARGARLAIFDASKDEAIYAEFPGNTLWTLSNETGAKVHSNSWGSDAGCVPEPSASLYDDFMYQNPEHLLIFSAGNSANLSSDPSYNVCTIGNPALGKNILAVGATSTGSTRQPTTSEDGSYDILDTGDNPADIDTVAWFSGRGNTLDDRIKPEVVAPGDQIFSAASDGTDTDTCRITESAGTSMACPLVSGAAAMVRQYFLNETFYLNDITERGLCNGSSAFICESFSPTSATVKAVLINSANLMGGSSEPDGDRGFGRIHLEAGMPLNGNGNLTLFVADASRTSIEENMEDVYSFDISATAGENDTSGSNATELRATLVWIDPASPAYSAKQLQHDLDLDLTSPDGDKYTMWTSGAADASNVIERVIVPAGSVSGGGRWTASVKSGTLTTESQAYSLVVTGQFESLSVSTANPAGEDYSNAAYIRRSVAGGSILILLTVCCAMEMLLVGGF